LAEFSKIYKERVYIIYNVSPLSNPDVLLKEVKKILHSPGNFENKLECVSNSLNISITEIYILCIFIKAKYNA
jgi:hypothetical protein